MSTASMRVLHLSGSPSDMGRRHGEAHGEEIRAYVDERVALVASGLWSGGPMGRDRVLDLAESCLDAHESFSPALFEELIALARGAGISPAEAVVVGGFTDFVDTVRAAVGGDHPDSVVEDDCTAVLVPEIRGGGDALLGQTWDMHDTATPHVVLLQLTPADAPAATVFTTTGCLGQIGINEAGVCVGINNLTGLDGRVGVTWPTVVREMLTRGTANEALDVLLAADLAGAHNYLVLDRDGIGFNVEAMPSYRAVQALGDEPVAHTNHVLDEVAAIHEAPRPPELRTGSVRRLELARDLLAEGVITPERLMDLTREPTAICQLATEPFHVESSGAAVMRPRDNGFWACWGRPVDSSFARYPVPAAASTIGTGGIGTEGERAGG